MVSYLTVASECFEGTVWENLYSMLVPFARRLVHSSGVGYWREQEEAIAEEIVQETMLRVWRYSQRAEHGEVPSVDSFKSVSMRITYNCYIDLRRRCERSLVNLTSYGDDHYPYADLVASSIDRGCDSIMPEHHRVAIFESATLPTMMTGKVEPLSRKDEARFPRPEARNDRLNLSDHRYNKQCETLLGEKDILGEAVANTS